MSVESGSYLNDLTTTLPTGGDIMAEGDDHIRLLKIVLKNTFPGLTGAFARTVDKAANYTVVKNDNTALLRTTAVVTLTLTATATVGPALFAVLAEANTTINRSGSDTINGGTSFTVPAGFLALLWSSGANGAYYAILFPLGNKVKTDSRSTNTILGKADHGKVILATAAYTQTLTAAATLGDGWWVDLRNDSTGDLVIDPSGTELVNGLSTLVLETKQTCRLVCNGTGFYTMNLETNLGSRLNGASMVNGSVHAAVAGNALTLHLKTITGGVPGSGDVVYIGFRSNTLTNGAVNVRAVTAATTLTIPAGATLGFANAEAGRIYIGAVDNAGTVELVAWNPVSGTKLFAPSEAGVVTTTAVTSGADAAHTLYSGTARTDVPITILGYIDIQTGATAGNWSNAPTNITTRRLGTPITGTVLQRQSVELTTLVSTSASIPGDDTIPQKGEGTELFTLSITPRNSNHQIQLRFEGTGSHNPFGSVGLALFKDAEDSARAAWWMTSAGNGYIETAYFTYACRAAGTAAITFAMRYGSLGAAGTAYMNGGNFVQRYLGGSLITRLVAEEVCT